MLTPLAIGALLLIVIPVLMTMVLAFLHYNGLEPPTAAGFDNFGRVWRDPIFRKALINSLLFVAIGVPVRLCIATGAALALGRPRRGDGAVRALVFLPTVVPDIAYALLWTWVVNPITGPFAPWLGASLLSTAWGARFTILLVASFQIGEAFLVAHIARREIPGAFYEQAAIEGASRWFTMRHITLPVMAPVLILLAARDAVLAFQASFVPALVITDGGPLYATTFLPLQVYRTGFSYLRFGSAAVMTLVALVAAAAMVAIMALTLRLAMRRRGGHLLG
jgi:multiple sugar transport system permease protein